MAVHTRPAETKPAHKAPPEVCCDLTCFERPRFFCGQLLTDVELKDDQRYGIDKHRLHNRLLHGAGVVCGLRVQCHPECDGRVIISPGYAIDCCGNDIVVCEPKPFNVHDAIGKYESKKRGDGCLPVPEQPGPREYCLSLVYREHEAKPVTALIRCNGSTATRCEPSRIVEGFDIEVTERDGQRRERLPTFLDRVNKCFETLRPSLVMFSRRESYAELATMSATLAPEFLRIRNRVREAYNKLGIRCAIPREYLEMEWPHEDPQAFRSRIPQAVLGATSLAGQLLLDCICEALLIECPECADPGVVVACIRIDGRTFHICNSARRPVFGYLSAQQWGPSFMTYGDDPRRWVALRSLLGVLAQSGVGIDVTRQPGSFPDLIERICCGRGPLERHREALEFDTPEVMLGHLRRHATYRASAIRMGWEGITRVVTAGVPGEPREVPADLPVIHIFDETPSTATAILEEQGYTVVGTRLASPEEGFLTGPTFTAALPGMRVELLTAADGRVVGFTPRAEPAAPPEVTDLRSRITVLEGKLADVEAIADVRTKIADLDARLATIPTTVAPAQALVEVRGKLTEIEAKLAEEIAARTAVPAASARDLVALTTKVDALETRVAASAPQLDALRGQLDELAGRPTITPAELATLRGQLAELDTRIGAAIPDVTDLKQKVRDLEGRIAALPPAIAAPEIEAVRRQLGELEARVNAVAPRFDEIRSRLVELDARVVGAPAEIATLRSRVADVEARIAAPTPLPAALMEAVQKVADLEARLKKVERRRPPAG